MIRVLRRALAASMMVLAVAPADGFPIHSTTRVQAHMLP